MKKLLVFSGNPTQYHSPLFRKINELNFFSMEVLFGDKIGAEPFYNEEFAAKIQWDVPVLDGYKYKFFKNHSSSQKKGFFSRNNPGIISYVYKNDSEYVLIHGYDTLTSWYVYFAALFSFKKIIWRGEAVEPASKASIKAKIKLLIKYLVLPLYFLGCHKVLYSCILNKRYLEKFVIKKNKLVSFPCSVDNNFFKQNKLKSDNDIIDFKNSLDIPINNVVVATCSRLTKRKRTIDILDSIANLKTKHITFLVIGDGPEKDNLIKTAKEKNVNLKCVGFVGQHQVAKLLSISNIFVLISEYDASPKALNEAMNFEIPIIVSEGVGTSIDLVKNNHNGFVIKNSNTHQLIDYLKILIDNIKDSNNMGKRNSNIIANYSYEIGINNMIKALEKNDRA